MNETTQPPAAQSAASPTRLFDVSGKTVMITGAGHGLGEMWAEGFAEAGSKIIAVDINEVNASAVAERLTKAGKSVDVQICDVTDAADVDKLEARLDAAGTEIDVLINSAGITHLSRAEDFPPEAYEKVLKVNLFGTFNMSRLAGRNMLRRGRGSIINIASIGGLIAYPNTVAYLSSKGGVVQLTRGMALEWAKKGIRVNALAPSRVETGFVAGQSAELAEEAVGWLESHQIVPQLIAKTELLGPALFLASDASKVVNGHTLLTENGYLTA